MCGPMGIGALWARRDLLDAMPPFQAGSNMVHEVELESAPERFAEGALKFEAGTPNVAGAVGLAAAVRFLESLGRKELWRREQELTEHVLSRLGKVKGLRILGPMKSSERISVFSFVVENGEPLDIAALLDRLGGCSTRGRPGIAACVEAIRCDGGRAGVVLHLHFEGRHRSPRRRTWGDKGLASFCMETPISAAKP